RASNHFLGAGPHVSLEVWRHLGCSPLAVYVKVEGSGMLGQIGQNFEEVFTVPGMEVGAASHFSKTNGVPTTDFQAGVSWSPTRAPAFRVTGGYQLESWWFMADTDAQSRGDLQVQGFFFRGEWNY